MSDCTVSSSRSILSSPRTCLSAPQTRKMSVRTDTMPDRNRATRPNISRHSDSGMTRLVRGLDFFFQRFVRPIVIVLVFVGRGLKQYNQQQDFDSSKKV